MKSPLFPMHISIKHNSFIKREKKTHLNSKISRYPNPVSSNRDVRSHKTQFNQFQYINITVSHIYRKAKHQSWFASQLTSIMPPKHSSPSQHSKITTTRIVISAINYGLRISKRPVLGLSIRFVLDLKRPRGSHSNSTIKV